MSEARKPRKLLIGLCLMGSLALAGCGEDEAPEPTDNQPSAEQDEGPAAGSPAYEQGVLDDEGEHKVLEGGNLERDEAVTMDPRGESGPADSTEDDSRTGETSEPPDQDSFDDTTAGGTAGGSLTEEEPDEQR
ncbi:hypothetical protein GCM10027040_05540 [Halomonas shantousis]